jgi:adenosylcobinamide-GDP ribazoletransferase
MTADLLYEARLLLTAVRYFTRVPVPAWVGHSAEQTRLSARYFPLVGILVGAWSAGVWWLCQVFLPGPVSLLLAMVAGILATGAFHEDGLADFCDGFGGGADRAAVLHIMKDSRVGSYGLLGLGAVLALKFAALSYLPPALLPLVLIAGHGLSRFTALTFLYTHSYAREEADAKAAAFAPGIGAVQLAVAGVFGLAPLALLPPVLLLGLLPLAALRTWLAALLRRRIGGYTGDCLGAAQQLSEVLFYLAVLGLWTST